MGPTLVRLAWHASGTYDKATNTGGSEGATMRFAPEAEFGANAGLGLARTALEPIKKAYPEMSYADLWTLAGCVAIQYMGGPAIGWRSGRVDKPDGSFCPPDGRLPDGFHQWYHSARKRHLWTHGLQRSGMIRGHRGCLKINFHLYLY